MNAPATRSRKDFCRRRGRRKISISRCVQFGQTVLRKSRTGKCDALSDRGRQEHPALAYLANGLDEIAGVAGLGNVPLGAGFDGARREDRVVVHAEHDDAGCCIARQNSPRQLKARDARQVDIEHADVGAIGDERRLAAFGVRGFQNGDIGIAGQQRTATRGNDRMVVNDSGYASTSIGRPHRQIAKKQFLQRNTNRADIHVGHPRKPVSRRFALCPSGRKCATVQLDSRRFLAVNV